MTVDSDGCFMGVQHRTDGHHLLNVFDRIFTHPAGNPQSKVASKGEPNQKNWFRRGIVGYLLNRLEYFLEQDSIKNTLI